LTIIERILDFFITSHDFNGIPFPQLAISVGMSEDNLRSALQDPIHTGQISLTFASHSGNAHIKRLPDLPLEEQITRLQIERPDGICVYPTAQVINVRVDLSPYIGRPFTHRLALAEPQLEAVYFDLAVMERYQRDPRYRFKFHDFKGSISIKSDHFDSPDVSERDKIFLETFGIGYDPRKRRVVLSFLRYLSRLSSEHQQVWAAHVLAEQCTANSDYFLASIYGKWPVSHSVYAAFLQERRELNKLAAIIGKPQLFKDDFVEERPPGFHSMLRPTKHNFLEFVQLLDKLLSESLTREFFEGDVELEQRVRRSDGTFDIERPGTLKLLEEWLSRQYRDANGNDVAREVLEPLRKVRSIRQKPAHAIVGDEYDYKYPDEQDQLLGSATRALTKLRLILSSHPRARDRYSPPPWLDSDNIVFY
jgi:hypothetical protein